MTRINANIPPYKLLDAHLIAEHRELTRVCSQLSKQLNSNKLKLVSKFKLGSGHQSFFLDKGKFLLNRYLSLKTELSNRGFKYSDNTESFKVYDNAPELFNDYEFSDQDNDLLKLRIVCRYYQMPDSKLKYKSEPISIESAIKLLDIKSDIGNSWLNKIVNADITEIKHINQTLLTL